MIQRIGSMVTAVFRRIVPDPLVIAIVLTIGVFVAAILWGRFPDDIGGPLDRSVWLLDAWRGGSGLWKLLAFAMQMCLILLGGHVLAQAPPIRRVLRRIADIPRSTPAAAAMVGLVAMMLGLVNWGLGPGWAKDSTVGNRMINARCETVAEKPSFRKAFEKRRCLVLDPRVHVVGVN